MGHAPKGLWLVQPAIGVVACHRRKRQTKAGGVGRHHHPRPSALPLVARTTHRFAIDCDDIPLTPKGGDVSQNPPDTPASNNGDAARGRFARCFRRNSLYGDDRLPIIALQANAGIRRGLLAEN